MSKFNLNDYEEVKDRLPKFYEKYPDGRVLTQIVHNENGTIIIKAFLYKNLEEQEKCCPLATGLAYEKEGEGFVNKTSHVENCETSAIGRALANITLHGDKRPSREEMKKVQRMSKNKTTDNNDEELF